MKNFYAAIVAESAGLRIFYVGEPTEEAAASALFVAHPELNDLEARFYPLSGGAAEPLGVTKSEVKEWQLGHPVRLTALTGSVIGD